MNVAAACALSRRLETDIRSRPDDKILKARMAVNSEMVRLTMTVF